MPRGPWDQALGRGPSGQPPGEDGLTFLLGQEPPGKHSHPSWLGPVPPVYPQEGHSQGF